MTQSHQITINGTSFTAKRGEVLLDAALKSGIDLPYDCRAGHCGTCCVRITSGNVDSGNGTEPGIVHACQCRITGNAAFEKDIAGVRTVEGELTSLRPLSADVIEVGIRTAATLPHHAGQYAQVTFAGYPGRPFSITHPLRSNPDGRALYFHIRRMENGRLTPHLGHRIRIGHKVSLAGPFGSAYFRPDGSGRLILVATNTGFAPIWSIAVAALRENPARRMMIIAGGRKIEALYMATALSQLVQFPNVLVVPVCSSQKTVNHPVMPGRPTDYMPYLLPTDSVYACGAPAMVDAIKAVSAHFGATCFADPFMPAAQESREEARVAKRTIGRRAEANIRTTNWSGFDATHARVAEPIAAYPISEAS